MLKHRLEELLVDLVLDDVPGVASVVLFDAALWLNKQLFSIGLSYHAHIAKDLIQMNEVVVLFDIGLGNNAVRSKTSKPRQKF